MTRTQIIQGPSGELVRGVSSDRLGLMPSDPLVHLWRASPYAVASTTQPRTLCGRRVAFGRHALPADAAICWGCAVRARRQHRAPVLRALWDIFRGRG